MPDRYSLTRLKIASRAGNYDVVIGSGTADAVVREADTLVVDRQLLDRIDVPGDTAVLAIDAGEPGKTLRTCEDLVLGLRSAGVRRGDHLVAVGGGSVQDVATFVAQIYMRGLRWSYIPTTLMAMADSCIGGKSSINVGGVKNVVGGIYPPQRVAVDPRFLATLPREDISAGLAEAVKICYCRGSAAFTAYLDHYASFGEQPEKLLTHALAAKKWFVEIDEHDQAERLQLNFGHTFGHALEAATNYTLSHGVAVAVGMLCALRHPRAVRDQVSHELEQHCFDLLCAVPGLDATLGDLDVDLYERAFRSDKKHASSSFRLVLPAATEGVGLVDVRHDSTGWSHILNATRSAIDAVSGARKAPRQ